MCIRYQLDLTPGHRRRLLGDDREDYSRRLFDDDFAHSQSHDVRPESVRPVVVNEGGRSRLTEMTWGWQQPRALPPLLSAYREAISTTALLKRAFAERRCVILATGYFEWRFDASATPYSKYLFKAHDGRLLRIAGLWDGEEGQDRCFLMITRVMSLQRMIHNRTPLILSSAAAEIWLDAKAKQADLNDAAAFLGDDHLAVREVVFTKQAKATDGPQLSVPQGERWPWEKPAIPQRTGAFLP